MIVFFRAVAHQLYGNPKFHLNIRALAVQYLRQHSERFIESNSENSWLEYRTNMSQKGTWCDNLIIQALADKLNIRIHIRESNPLFAEISVTEPVYFTTDIQTIHLGHTDELFYTFSLNDTGRIIKGEEQDGIELVSSFWSFSML